MKTDIFKEKAIVQARKSSYKQRMGAVAVFKGDMVGFGHNKVFTIGRRATSFHAEMEALNDSPASCRDGSTVWVCRINKREDLVMAKPCAACQTKMRKIGVKYVWFSCGGRWRKMTL